MNASSNIPQEQYGEILSGLKNFYEKGRGSSEFPMLDHISNDLTRKSYLDKCAEIIQAVPQDAKFLDWGTGFGQISYILAKLGKDVTAYDVIRRQYSLLPLVGKELVFGEEEVKLPFPDDSFDVVIGCGVLEHVPNILGSLQELYRVIKPGGSLYIYNLPYVFSPSEAYAAHRGISVHPIKFTKLGTKQLLELANFQVEKVGHENGIPKRFAGPLKHFRFLADRFPKLFMFLDRLIIRTPLVRSVLSNSIKIKAAKPRGAGALPSKQLTHLWWD